MNLISTTELQKNPTKVIDQKPIQIILNNNKLRGLLLSAELSEMMIESGVLQQIQEELDDLQDKVTVDLVRSARSRKAKTMSFEDYRAKYDV